MTSSLQISIVGKYMGHVTYWQTPLYGDLATTQDRYFSHGGPNSLEMMKILIFHMFLGDKRAVHGFPSSES